MQHGQPFGRSPALDCIPDIKADNQRKQIELAASEQYRQAIDQINRATDRQAQGLDALGGSLAPAT